MQVQNIVIHVQCEVTPKTVASHFIQSSLLNDGWNKTRNDNNNNNSNSMIRNSNINGICLMNHVTSRIANRILLQLLFNIRTGGNLKVKVNLASNNRPHKPIHLMGTQCQCNPPTQKLSGTTMTMPWLCQLTRTLFGNITYKMTFLLMFHRPSIVTA